MTDNVAIEPMTLEQLSQKDYFVNWGAVHSAEIVARAKQIILEAIQHMQLLDSDADYDDKAEIIIDAVLRFNDLNEDYDNFIETNERESICEELFAIAAAVGLERDDFLIEDRDW